MIIRNLEALFTINTNASQFKKAMSELDTLASKAEGVMKAIAGYWAVGVLQNFVTNSANAMAEVGKTAGYLGLTTDALQELHYAANKSGVALDTLEDSLKELQIRSVDAKSGSGDAAAAFAALEIKATDAAGKMREPLELLSEVADGINTLPTQSDRLWVADAMFGDQGAKMLMVLRHGSLGLRKMREEARATGRVMGGESINQAERLIKSINRLKNVSIDAGRVMSSWSFPVLTKSADAISTAFERLNNFKVSQATSDMVKTGFLGSLALAATKATQALIPLWPALSQTILLAGKMALRASPIIAGLLLLQDLWSMFRGADSVAGECVKIFTSMGRGVMSFVKAASSAIGKGLSEAWGSFKKEFGIFSQWVSGVASAIKERFAGLFDGLIPDFLKNNFTATLKTAGGTGEKSQHLNSRLAPMPSNISNQSRISNHQNVSVAVNVKSGADPKEIGGEVSKAFRKEFERERFNAFMGVTQYAG